MTVVEMNPEDSDVENEDTEEENEIGEGGGDSENGQ